MANKKDAAKAQAAQTNESANTLHFEIIKYHGKEGKESRILIGDTKPYSDRLKKIATFAANLYGASCEPVQPTDRVKGWFVTERNEEQIAEFMADPDGFVPQPKKLGKKAKPKKKTKAETEAELAEAMAEIKKLQAKVKAMEEDKQ